MNASLFLFSNFKKINWLLKKLYMDVFTDANKHQQIDRIIPSQCDPIIDYSTCIIWLQFCDHDGRHRPVKVPDVMREGKQFVTKCYGRNQLSSYENRCAIWKNKTVDHSVQKVWIPPSIDTPSLYGRALVFIFFSKPPAFGKTFSTISPQWNTW